MSLETFEASRRQAADLMGMSEIEFKEIQDATEPEVFYLGDIKHKGNTHHAYTAQSGNFHPDYPNLHRGGTRWTVNHMSPENARALVGELSAEMRGKRGGLEGGRKGLIVGGAKSYEDPRDQEIVMRGYADLMDENGFAGPYKHIVSADMNTGGLSDPYALQYALRTGDPLWKASAAGKSVKYGGLAVRPETTGLGTVKWHKEAMLLSGERLARIAIMGFGQVGAWVALDAEREDAVDFRVNAISDVGGMLTTDDPHGITITMDILKNIGDNREFSGNKIAALQDALAANGIKTDYHSDESRIVYVDTDYFIPAAGPDVISLPVARNLGARRGVIEAANGPTHPDAHKYLVQQGLIVAPDFSVNKQGVNCSSIEWGINVGEIDPNTVDPRQYAIEDAEKSARDTIHIAKELGTRDLRVAAAAINLAQLAQFARVTA